MGILAWIVVGIIAGFLARAVVGGTDRGGGILGDLVVGIIGAILGGWLFLGGVTGINLGSILVAFIGAVIFLVIWRAITGAGRHAPRAT